MESLRVPGVAITLARSWLFRTALGAFVFFGLFSALATARFGSPALGLAYLKGVRLVMQPSVVDLGTGRDGEERHLSFRVINLERQPVKLIGSRTTCGCVATKGIPVQIPGGGSRLVEVDVRINSREDAGFEQALAFFTDLPEQRTVEASIIAQVANSSAKP